MSKGTVLDRTTITSDNSVGHSGARVTRQVRAAGLVGDVQQRGLKGAKAQTSATA